MTPTPRRIAFVQFSNGHAELYVTDTAGRNTKRLTNQSSREGDAITGRDEEALAIAGMAEPLARAAPPPEPLAFLLMATGLFLTGLGRYGEAKARLEEGLALARRNAPSPRVAECLGNLGVVAYFEGRRDDAEALYREALAIDRQIGDELNAALMLFNIAEVVMDRGDSAEAARLVSEMLEIALRLNVGRVTGGIMRALAALHERIGDDRGAARFLGAERRIRDRFGQESWQRREHDEQLARLSYRLSPTTFEELAAEGRGLPMDEVAAALDRLRNQ